jgi:two-component system, response regulator YesN
MYSILIVDDDRIVRESVKFLIDEYHLPFTISEAPNGKAALAHLKDQPTDILFTDIKMPFLDGLELAYEARELNPNIKIVILSAYGEFDYAKKAIELKAIRYILKPINISEFLHVMRETVELCKEEEKKKQAEQEHAEASLKAERYEKEKLLMNLLSGSAVDDKMLSTLRRYDFLYGQAVRMVLIDIRSRFFDKNNDRFLAELKNIAPREFEYLNLNERQSVLFIKLNNASDEEEAVRGFFNNLKEALISKFDVEPCLVISKAIESANNIRNEYSSLENTLNYRFYNPGSFILYTESKAIYTNYGFESIDDILENVKKAVYTNQIDDVKSGIDLIIEALKHGEGISPIYAKSVFIDIIRLLKTKKSSRNVNLDKQIDTVIQSIDIKSLKNIISDELGHFAEDSRGTDSDKNIVNEVYKIVHKKYYEDINLEWIADQIFLSAGYLSFLFKKETGISLIKYITQYRMEKAKELLDNSNLKINDIAEKVGYSDPSYFSMVFKNNVGFSPNRYRERRK